jgi:hypothetical protein
MGSELTRESIRAIHAAEAYVNILTKAGLRSTRDFDLLGADDLYATTLTFRSEDKSREWEPQAALPQDRLQAMSEAHDRGIKTWASLEPVIDPEETLAIATAALPFCDFYKVGKLNHMKVDVEWPAFARAITGLLNDHGKPYYLKRDLCSAAGIEWQPPEAARRLSPKAPAQAALAL